MSALNASFTENGHTIELKADLRQGWDMGPKTYSFSRETSLECRADIRLRMSLKVYPRPVGLGPCRELFPSKLSCSGTDPIPFQVRESTLTFHIPLICDGVNFDLPWNRTKTGKFGFWWNDIEIGTDGTIRYTAQLLVVIDSQIPMREPIDWVKAEKGILSGQFESNRRRH